MITYYERCSNLQHIYVIPAMQCMDKCIRDLCVGFAMFSGQQKATEVSFKQTHSCNFAPVANFGPPAAQ